MTATAFLSRPITAPTSPAYRSHASPSSFQDNLIGKMEKVQFVIESTIPELRDLEEKKLFTKSELQQITRRRTRFETSLIKRVVRKDDFFAYAEYEIGLDSLRRLRWKKLKYDKNPPPRSISSHSITRRVQYILRRASEKFPYDLEVWMAYHDFARSEGMVKVVRELLTKALQLHPLEPSLYILLAQQYLSPPATPGQRSKSRNTTFALENVGPARKALLLGLRFLPKDRTLWIEYIKLEIGWVEALRRRWRILGIAEEDDKAEKDVQDGLPRRDPTDEEEENDLGQNAFGESGEDARKAIMRGDLVKTVLQSSFDRLGDEQEYYQALLRLLRNYPTGLRSSLLRVVYTHLLTSMSPALRRFALEADMYDRDYDPEETKLTPPEGWDMEADESIPAYTDPEDEQFILRMASTVEKMQGQLREGGLEGWGDIFGHWLIKWGERVEKNEDLRDFLLVTLESLMDGDSTPSESLLLSHLDLLSRSGSESSTPERLIETAARYVRMSPSSPRLWLAYTEWAKRSGQSPEVLNGLYIRGMDATADSEDASIFWIPAMEHLDTQSRRRGASTDLVPSHWRHALTSARRRPTSLYADLVTAWGVSRLERLFKSEGISTTTSATHSSSSSSSNPTPTSSASSYGIEDVIGEFTSQSMYAPAGSFGAFFQALVEYRTSSASSASTTKSSMRKVYEVWTSRAFSLLDEVNAGMAYAAWLLSRGQGGAKEAFGVYERLTKRIQAVAEDLQNPQTQGSSSRSRSGANGQAVYSRLEKKRLQTGPKRTGEVAMEMQVKQAHQELETRWEQLIEQGQRGAENHHHHQQQQQQQQQEEGEEESRETGDVVMTW